MTGQSEIVQPSPDQKLLAGLRPEKVVIINDRSKAMGGATSLALLSARLLSLAGVKVHFISGDTGDGAQTPPGVQLHALGGRPLLQQNFSERARRALFNEAAFALVREVIAREDTPSTVYHLHGWAQTLSASVFRALKGVEDRLVISAHDFSMVCPNGSYFDFRTDAVCARVPLGASCLTTNCDKRRAADKAFRVARLLLRRSLIDLKATRALVAVIHPYMTDWLVRGGIEGSRIRTLRNPVSPFREERVIAEANNDIFFIGRVESEKGVALAAGAARAAGRRLRVIGDGSERERLTAAFPEVIWEGWSDHARIGRLISEARALIMPSRLPEPFGLVALEALLCGVPLIAFSDSFIAQEAEARGAAFLATSRTPAGLANAIRQIDNPQRVAHASQMAFTACRSLASTQSEWEAGLFNLYSECLTASANRAMAPA